MQPASQILGMEFSGIVQEVGSTSKFKVADEVFGLVAGVSTLSLLSVVFQQLKLSEGVLRRVCSRT